MKKPTTKRLRAKKNKRIVCFSIKKIFLILFFCLFLYGCKQKPRVEINDVIIEVELAETIEERAKGLMYREKLDKMSGMLFIFDEEQTRSFWMKNTLIPLDIFFIDANNIIVDIQTMDPCKNDPCISYASKKPAMFALEVNSGFAEKFNISEGNTFKILI